MWFESWYGDLVFGNESLLAYNIARCRKMRPVRKVGHRSARKHIAARVAGGRMQSTAAKDG